MFDILTVLFKALQRNTETTYPLPRPGTYPRGAVTPRKGFLFFCKRDILNNIQRDEENTFSKWRLRPRLDASTSSLTVHQCAPFFENQVVKFLSMTNYASKYVFSLQTCIDMNTCERRMILR